jgi:hypothetical protein
MGAQAARPSGSFLADGDNLLVDDPVGAGFIIHSNSDGARLVLDDATHF